MIVRAAHVGNIRRLTAPKGRPPAPHLAASVSNPAVAQASWRTEAANAHSPDCPPTCVGTFGEAHRTNAFPLSRSELATRRRLGGLRRQAEGCCGARPFGRCQGLQHGLPGSDVVLLEVREDNGVGRHGFALDLDLRA